MFTACSASFSVDQHSFRMDTFTVCHTFENDLPPDANAELNGFFFKNLWKEIGSAPHRDKAELKSVLVQVLRQAFGEVYDP